jgi:hypothetical protein
VAEGYITMAAIEASKSSKKGIVFPKIINAATGKLSKTKTSFNVTNWGTRTRYYHACIKEDLQPETMDEIMLLASDHFKATSVTGGRSSSYSNRIMDGHEGGERVRLVDNPDRCESLT